MNKKSSFGSITTPADMAAAQAIVSQANRLGMNLNEFAVRSMFFSLPQQQQVPQASSIAAALQQQQNEVTSSSSKAMPLDLNDYAALNPMFNLGNYHTTVNNSTLSNYARSNKNTDQVVCLITFNYWVFTVFFSFPLIYIIMMRDLVSQCKSHRIV